MEIRFDRKDFKEMVSASRTWTDDLAQQDGRWEAQQDGRWEGLDSTSNDFWITGWGYAYWIGDRWLDAMFMRAWLDNQDEKYDLLWDSAEGEYVILTNCNVHDDED